MGKRAAKLPNLYSLLPYGITSQHTLIFQYMTEKISEDIFAARQKARQEGVTQQQISAITHPAYMEYDPTIPMSDRERVCYNLHIYGVYHIAYLRDCGYIDEAVYRFGKLDWEEFRAYSLTNSALYLLSGTIDPKTEIKRNKNLPSDHRASYYYPWSSSFDDLRQELGVLSGGDPQEYDRCLLESVYQGAVSLLARDQEGAKTVDTAPVGVSKAQRYKRWRLSNVESMFRTNGFLTHLDRRPMDRYWPLWERDKQEEEGSFTVKEFVDRTLKKWYNDYPLSYSFTAPQRALTEDKIDQWKRTPAFYASHEIPGFGADIFDDEDMTMTGQRNVLRYNFIGLAVGRVCNYLVYHTKPKQTPWGAKTEMTTASAVQECINDADRESPVHGAGHSTIENALIFCPNVQQFENLFVVSRERMSKKRSRSREVGTPYRNVNIIPINTAGAMQLNVLMKTIPTKFDERVMFGLLEKYPTMFEKASDRTFPLIHKGKPVLLAHSMNYQVLFNAWEDYLEGREFYVSCYPEQAKYIRRIMPKVKFL